MKRRVFLKMKSSMVMTMMMRLVMVVMATATMAAPLGHGIPSENQSPGSVEKWFRSKLPNAKHKFTKLHFYSHENIYSKNPTAVPIAKANITSGLGTLFGLVMVVDNKLTVGPEPGSKVAGFAQGTYASASMQEERLLTTLNFVFTDGKYKGSSLSVLGCNPIFRQYKELAVVGGSGIFRLARGSATAETYTFDGVTGDPIVEYHVNVLHY